MSNPRNDRDSRGYGRHHKQLRKQWAPQVEAGHIDCARCGAPIRPGTPWDLGHNDHDRTRYSGPEHRRCNRGAPSRRLAQTNQPPPSRNW